MKITNDMYPRGSIIITSGDDSFVNHPLIVMSQMELFDQLTCIVCTSRNRPGIEVSIYNHYQDKFNGEKEYSIAMPYRVVTVQIKKIDLWLGTVNPITMKAISDAFAWHMGLSDVVPPYMTKMIEEDFAPTYNMGNAENGVFRISQANISCNERGRKFPYKRSDAYVVPNMTQESYEVSKANSIANRRAEKIEARFIKEGEKVKNAITTFFDKYLVPHPNGMLSVAGVERAFHDHSGYRLIEDDFIVKIIDEAATRGIDVAIDNFKATPRAKGFKGILFNKSVADNSKYLNLIIEEPDVYSPLVSEYFGYAFITNNRGIVSTSDVLETFREFSRMNSLGRKITPYQLRTLILIEAQKRNIDVVVEEFPTGKGEMGYHGLVFNGKRIPDRYESIILPEEVVVVQPTVPALPAPVEPEVIIEPPHEFEVLEDEPDFYKALEKKMRKKYSPATMNRYRSLITMFDNIDEETRVKLLLRLIPEDGYVRGVKMYGSAQGAVRNIGKAEYGYDEEGYLISLSERLERNEIVPEHEIIGGVLYGNLDELFKGPNQCVFQAFINISSKYGVDFIEGTHWRRLRNFSRIRDLIYSARQDDPYDV